MNKHTPGPWTAAGHLVRCHPDRVFTGAIGYAYGEDDNGQDDDECLANAILMAAAPDLLAALQPFAELHVMGDNYVQFSPALIAAARAAIAKAEGK